MVRQRCAALAPFAIMAAVALVAPTPLLVSALAQSTTTGPPAPKDKAMESYVALVDKLVGS